MCLASSASVVAACLGSYKTRSKLLTSLSPVPDKENSPGGLASFSIPLATFMARLPSGALMISALSTRSLIRVEEASGRTDLLGYEFGLRNARPDASCTLFPTGNLGQLASNA